MPGGKISGQSVASPRGPLDDTERPEKTTPDPNRKLSRSQSQSLQESPVKPQSPVIRRSPRKRSKSDVNLNGGGDDDGGGNRRLPCSVKSPRKRLFDQLSENPRWNPRDPVQMKAVKRALYVGTAPENIVCREDEQKKIVEFCKACILQEKAGSLYVCGCPGTGKTLAIDKVKELLVIWSKGEGFQTPEVLSINCTSLTNASEIFNKMLEKFYPCLKTNGTCSPLQHLQKLFSQKTRSSSGRMMIIIVDEMDYLITKDRTVLHEIFMLTMLPSSKCILIGIANAIDLADRFLPKLESLNCKPTVVTFRAYSKDQILKILQQRLMILGFDVFEPIALEFCARKVAAASGDMRRVLAVCRSAVELLEAELRVSTIKQDVDIVRFDHMDIALSKAFKPVIVDTIQSLPQHQQIILCSVLKNFHQFKKKATTIAELNKSYSELCKAKHIPAVGMLEFTNLCRALSDQGLLKLGPSKEVKQKKVTLQIDGSDIVFALKNIRFFHNCLD